MTARSRSALSLAASVLVLALNVGCASFRTGDLDRDVALPPAAAPKPSIAVVVTGRVSFDGRTTQDATAPMLQQWRTSILGTYRRSDLFTSVESGFQAADLRAEVEVVNSGKTSIGLAMLSGATLTLIPAKATDVLTMTTVFRDAAGEELITVERRAVVSTWIQLFLLPVMPFKTPGSTVEGAFEDLVLHTLAAAGDSISVPTGRADPLDRE